MVCLGCGSIDFSIIVFSYDSVGLICRNKCCNESLDFTSFLRDLKNKARVEEADNINAHCNLG